MTKFWQIAWHEYSRHVFRRRFIIVLLSVPLLVGFMALLIILVLGMDSDPTPIGYIDHSGLLSDPVPQPPVKWPERTTPMLPYSDEVTAREDLQAGKLQAYYVIPVDFLQTGRVERVYVQQPSNVTVHQVDQFFAVNLLKGQPEEIATRVLDGSSLAIQSADKSLMAPQDRLVNLLLPFLSGILFIIAMSTSSGYLMQAVVEEKENRTMEIMVTSVSPGQLMGGKIIGDMAIGVTQLLVWTIFIILFLVFGKSYIPSLEGLRLSGQTIGTIIAVMVPAYIMISALMAAIGATVTEGTEGQQIVGLFTIPIWLPYFFIAAFLQNPNSPLAVAMSFFPLTAPMTLAMRIGVINVPAWQVATSVAILVLSAIGSIWLAGRAFRLGMLRYGQRLRWVEIFRRQGA